jgi:aminopeptidase
LHTSAGNPLKTKLQKAADIVINDCLAIRKREKVIVVTDHYCRRIGYVLWKAAQSVTDPVILEIIPRNIHGEEPPLLVAEILKKCDVFILPTSCSLTHTQARINACKNGARGATLPGITDRIMERSLNADYRWIAKTTKHVASLLTKAKKVTIKTKNSHLELNITSRQGYTDTGIITKAGEFSNLPGGEAYIAPLEHMSNGTVTIDGSFAPIGHLKKNVNVHVENGRIVQLSGSRKMSAIFNRYGKRERTLCELGIGTNPRARITGNVLEDEKSLGSIHVAFGNNLGFGGRNNAQIHVDGVVKKDGMLIIKNGKFL